ncbi:hypothetical protein [Cereibacter johrii]|uniref:Integral membrane protein n=1 Tax=Cereibacter johrii TaxID=445629 RepID=A0ABX5J4L3_9RHOB|nr:hypothetical protein [Cereibacter johrii]PTM76737.1 hypothetical protein C8J29_10713 [Cereibacter johrii]
MSSVVALLVGAAVVVLFSYDRFNRASYETGRQLERLVDLLTPEKLRARRIILRAYFFYALAMLAIYFFLCAYAELLPQLGATGLPAPETASPLPGSDGAAGALGIDPATSLTIALIMVGLAPSFPVLQRFEIWIRLIGHSLAGIPTRIVEWADELSRHTLELEPERDNTLMIPRNDWERMRRYERAARDHVPEPDDFRSDMALILATSSWLFGRRIKLDNPAVRERFDAVETALRRRKDALLLDLDEQALEIERGQPDDAAEEAKGPTVSRAVTWARLAKDADQLAYDICILLALYVEHDVITLTAQPDPPPATGQEEKGEARRLVRQQELARARLNAFLTSGLGDAPLAKGPRSLVLLPWLWTTGLVAIVALCWSIFPGRYEYEMQQGEWASAAFRAFTYLTSALMTYAVPMILALALRDAARFAGRWNNLWTSHWTVSLPQAVILAGLSWLIALACFLGLVLWTAAISKGWAQSQNAAFETLKLSLLYNGPTALRGAVLALMVLLLIDARDATLHPVSILRSFAWAGAGALVMALAGGATRTVSSLAMLGRSGRAGLDAVDLGLICYAMIQSLLIGALVLFCLSEALRQRQQAEQLHRHRILGTHRSRAAWS